MAEIIFGNPADMHPTIAELVKRDFAVLFLEDWYDEYSAALGSWPPLQASSTSPRSSIP